jgi:hypothetical protein
MHFTTPWSWRTFAHVPLKVEVVVWDQEDFEQARVVFNAYRGREVRQAEENRLAEEALKKLLGN